MKEYGQECDAWKDMVEYLNAQHINGEDLVYKKGILLDTVQRRWKQYITLVKRFQAPVLCDTGTGNEVTPPLYMSWKTYTTIGNPSQQNNCQGRMLLLPRKKDLDACDDLHQAGMGNLAAMNNNEAEGTIDLAANEDDDTKPAARKKRKANFVVGSTMMVEMHKERMIQKENNKKLSLELKSLCEHNQATTSINLDYTQD
jgi:hypothetical protein